ncbi:hypothetical protein [Paraburkholderia saeva]|uniref:Uncharacterized protein n=1 Tax=Paraburkholderia saeva TaxID=2777537 RepID=A0A9N8S0P9_9BURK|nr:hypothetical protein [Paraburkholderia saeva]CAG4918299.1 hypothetical protein LMG31841_04771 [Paraburkholderia saeva]
MSRSGTLTDPPFATSTAAKGRAKSRVTPLQLWSLWIIGTVLASLPFLILPVPPLGQHFYNIVRIDILAHPDRYASNFVVHWDMVPDLAMDLAGPLLVKWMTVEQAARLFVLASLALLSSGCLMLGRAVNGRWSILPLMSFLLLYNWILIRGYANNLSGLGLCFWALAAHVALRRHILARILVSVVSACVIYVCHLFPLAVFALIACTWELGCLIQSRDLRVRSLCGHAAACAIPFVLPALLLWHSSTRALTEAIDFGFLQMAWRIRLGVAAFTIGERAADIVILVSLCVAGVIGTARHWWTCRPECRLTVVALPVVLILAPFTAFSAYGIVERCALAFAFLLTALLDVRIVDPKLQRIGAVALIFVFLFRVGTVAHDWQAAKPVMEAYRQAFASLKPGAVLMQFKQDAGYPLPLKDPHRWNPYLDKVVALATLDGVLVPDLYLKAGQQPVLYRPENVALRTFQVEGQINNEGAQVDDHALRTWAAAFLQRFPQIQSRFPAIYLAVFDPHMRLSAELPGWRLVATLPEHRLYELDR